MNIDKLGYILGLFFICWVMPVSAAHILVIESYHKEYRWGIGYKSALYDQLGARHQFNFFEMDTKRIPKSSFQEKANQAWSYYLKTNPDIVVLADDNALKYLGKKFSETSTPVVYLGINNNPRNYGIYNSSNITGVLERPLIKRSILSVRRLIPKLANVLVLFDAGNTSLTSLSIELSNRSMLKIHGVTVEVKLIEDYQLWQFEITSASNNKYDAIIIGLYHALRDKKNQHVSSITAINWASQSSLVPLFGLWDFSVGKHRTIGGLVLQSYDQGYQASLLIKEILSGTSPGDIRPQTAKKGTYIYSRNRLKNYDLTVPDDIVKVAKFVE